MYIYHKYEPVQSYFNNMIYRKRKKANVEHCVRGEKRKRFARRILADSASPTHWAGPLIGTLNPVGGGGRSFHLSYTSLPPSPPLPHTPPYRYRIFLKLCLLQCRSPSDSKEQNNNLSWTAGVCSLVLVPVTILVAR
jgi:hypothetical protein